MKLTAAGTPVLHQGVNFLNVSGPPRIHPAVFGAPTAIPGVTGAGRMTNSPALQRAQDQLTKIGYMPYGQAYGRNDFFDQQALRRFQQGYGLHPTGELNHQTVNALDYYAGDPSVPVQ